MLEGQTLQRWEGREVRRSAAQKQQQRQQQKQKKQQQLHKQQKQAQAAAKTAAAASRNRSKQQESSNKQQNQEQHKQHKQQPRNSEGQEVWVPKVGPRRVGSPKFRVFFFPSPATVFILFSSLGGRFVEFWWCD